MNPWEAVRAMLSETFRLAARAIVALAHGAYVVICWNANRVKDWFNG